MARHPTPQPPGAPSFTARFADLPDLEEGASDEEVVAPRRVRRLEPAPPASRSPDLPRIVAVVGALSGLLAVAVAAALVVCVMLWFVAWTFGGGGWVG